MLYIFAGLPGSGKTTLSRVLASRLRAVHLRVDTIEAALTRSGYPLTGPEGYLVAFGVAADNLRLGHSVIADSVNPVPESRRGWRDVALRTDSPYCEIEVVCSDPRVHRRRVEGRPSDIVGFRLPTWEEVVGREYQPWDTPPLVIDTAGRTVDECVEELLAALAE